jgi:hypothetical protein
MEHLNVFISPFIMVLRNIDVFPCDVISYSRCKKIITTKKYVQLTAVL